MAKSVFELEAAAAVLRFAEEQDGAAVLWGLIFQEIDGMGATSEMIMQIGCERIVHHFPHESGRALRSRDAFCYTG